jgi:hypothetical protein
MTDAEALAEALAGAQIDSAEADFGAAQLAEAMMGTLTADASRSAEPDSEEEPSEEEDYEDIPAGAPGHKRNSSRVGRRGGLLEQENLPPKEEVVSVRSEDIEISEGSLFFLKKRAKPKLHWFKLHISLTSELDDFKLLCMKASKGTATSQVVLESIVLRGCTIVEDPDPKKAKANKANYAFKIVAAPIASQSRHTQLDPINVQEMHVAAGVPELRQQWINAIRKLGVLSERSKEKHQEGEKVRLVEERKAKRRRMALQFTAAGEGLLQAVAGEYSQIVVTWSGSAILDAPPRSGPSPRSKVSKEAKAAQAMMEAIEGTLSNERLEYELVMVPKAKTKEWEEGEEEEDGGGGKGLAEDKKDEKDKKDKKEARPLQGRRGGIMKAKDGPPQVHQ